MAAGCWLLAVRCWRLAAGNYSVEYVVFTCRKDRQELQKILRKRPGTVRKRPGNGPGRTPAGRRTRSENDILPRLNWKKETLR